MKKMTHTVKTRHTFSLILMAILLIVSYTANAQVAITADGSPGDASAMLDVKSTTGGFLPPRMTAAQRDAIANPAVGLIIYCTDCAEVEVYNGTAWVNMVGGAATISSVTSATGKTWMDRNVGSSRVATSSTDAAAYGGLYQWGRAADGHQILTSATTTTLASTPVPNGGNAWDGKFITSGSSPYDWLSTQDNTLWQGVSGTNNPCPPGFRLPTDAEWDAERQSWGSDNTSGAYGSPLKLTAGGIRDNNGSRITLLTLFGGLHAPFGVYWSSTVSSISARSLHFHAYFTYIDSDYRANGFSVRCIRN